MTMSDQTKINTAGPEDPKAPSRAKSYAVTAGLLALLPVLVAFNVLTQEQAASLIETYGALAGVAGAFGLSIASYMTRKQVNNGTFDAPADPERNALETLAVIRQQADDDINAVMTSAAQGVQAIKSATSMIPGVGRVVGGASGAVLPGAVGDIIQWARDTADGQ